MSMVCSSVAVVKIAMVNWMKYHGCDMHMMLRERERVREWITQSAWVRACRVWLLRDCMHVYVSEGCPLLLVTKQQHQGFKVLLSFWPLGARKRSYIRTQHSLWTSIWVLLINNYHTTSNSKDSKDRRFPRHVTVGNIEVEYNQARMETCWLSIDKLN